jgi:hypothetical protein
MQPASSRQPYLDWLRIISILCVFFLHSGMAFVAEWWWHLKDAHPSQLLMEINFQLSRLRMPLLFFVSGTVTWYMLQKRTSGSFIGLRFRRLFIPLLFGMLVIVPPQIYMERLTQGFKGNYLDFYPTVFSTGVYPKGNLSWHHLWFIMYLFVFDVVFAAFFKWAISEHGQQRLAFFNKLANGKWIYLLMVPGIAIFTSMNIAFPETHDLIHDWCNLLYSLCFLLGGFMCVNFPRLINSLERNRRTSLLLVFISLMAIDYLRFNKLEPFDVLPNWRSDIRTYVYIALYPLASWACVFAAIGYAKKYLNKKHRVLNYLNEAVYPFYILHQTIIVIIVYYVIKTNDPVDVKFVFTFLAAFAVTTAIYHLLVRPFAVTRFLFGMKPKSKVTGYQSDSSPIIIDKGQVVEKDIHPTEITQPATQIL